MRRPPHGFTLVETLVAIAVFAVLAAAVAGLWSTALRTSAAAERSTARARALEPHTVPAALAAAPPDPCGPDGAPSPCLAAVTRCRVDPVRVTCAGEGPLLRLALRVPAAGGPAPPDAAADDELIAWARVAP